MILLNPFSSYLSSKKWSLKLQSNLIKNTIWACPIWAQSDLVTLYNKDQSVISRHIIDTPLGSYNPDWAVLIERDGKDKLYFVVETKGNEFDLRGSEQAKIDCGKKHFEALGNEVHYEVISKYEKLRERIDKKLEDAKEYVLRVKK